MSRVVRTPAPTKTESELKEFDEEEYEKYIDYVQYDEFKVISSDTKDCPKCKGVGIINIVTTNHIGKNYDHRHQCTLCLGTKRVLERLVEKSQYRNR